ncbi:signal peptidase II [Aquihabitans sp. McL0605]|uniref:signal peptidase II n=1 Tax=Aquihabitans sp. McL0605 TaxID=3415671 RepID=UPI003CF59C03
MLPVLWSLVVALAVAALDRATKRSVTLRLAEGERRPIVGGVAVARVTNQRAGLVRLSTAAAVAVAVVVLSAAAVVLVQPGVGAPVAVGLGLLVGGMAGNVVDRVRHGGVVDLLAVGRWPVFNAADAALVVGALVVLAALVGSVRT